MTPEEAVRTFFEIYNAGVPERFNEVVSPDYLDYGHTPPGRGPKGAQDDYENAIQLAGGVPPRYDIDALVTRDDTVAAAWTGHRANGSDFRGLSLYRVVDGLIVEARLAIMGPLPDS